MSNRAVVAYGGTTRTRRPTGHESPPGLSEPAPKASPQKKRRRSRPRKVGQQQGSQVTPFLVAGLVGEVIVPWGVVWLSDMLGFDVPAWSEWPIFGGPLALTLMAMLIYWAVRTRSNQRRHASAVTVSSFRSGGIGSASR